MSLGGTAPMLLGYPGVLYVSKELFRMGTSFSFAF